MLDAVLLDPLPIGLYGGAPRWRSGDEGAALEQTVAVEQKQSADIYGPIQQFRPDPEQRNGQIPSNAAAASALEASGGGRDAGGSPGQERLRPDPSRPVGDEPAAARCKLDLDLIRSPN
jgi:hypothetical protein